MVVVVGAAVVVVVGAAVVVVVGAAVVVVVVATVVVVVGAAVVVVVGAAVVVVVAWVVGVVVGGAVVVFWAGGAEVAWGGRVVLVDPEVEDGVEVLDPGVVVVVVEGPVVDAPLVAEAWVVGGLAGVEVVAAVATWPSPSPPPLSTAAARNMPATPASR